MTAVTLEALVYRESVRGFASALGISCAGLGCLCLLDCLSLWRVSRELSILVGGVHGGEEVQPYAVGEGV